MFEFMEQIRSILPEGWGVNGNTVQDTLSIVHGKQGLTLESDSELTVARWFLERFRAMQTVVPADNDEPVTPAWLQDMGCTGIGNGIFELEFVDMTGCESWIQFEPARGFAEVHSNVMVKVENRGQYRALMAVMLDEKVMPCSSE